MRRTPGSSDRRRPQIRVIRGQVAPPSTPLHAPWGPRMEDHEWKMMRPRVRIVLEFVRDDRWKTAWPAGAPQAVSTPARRVGSSKAATSSGGAERPGTPVRAHPRGRPDDGQRPGPCQGHFRLEDENPRAVVTGRDYPHSMSTGPHQPPPCAPPATEDDATVSSAQMSSRPPAAPDGPQPTSAPSSPPSPTQHDGSRASTEPSRPHSSRHRQRLPTIIRSVLLPSHSPRRPSRSPFASLSYR